MGKSDKSTINHRIDVVYTLILQGWRSGAMCRSLSEKWGVSERQIERYIEQARELISEEAAKRRERAFDRHIEAMADLYRGTKDERLKLEILKNEAKLLALYPAKETKTEVVISDRERLDRIMELSNAARERRSKEPDKS